MIEFQWPWLFLLLPLPWLVRRKSTADAAMSGLHIDFYERLGIASYASAFTQNKPERWQYVGLLLAWICLIASAARPFYIGEPVTIPQTGRDLMLAVDISPSMREQDMVIQNYQVDRLTAVKKVVGQFIEQRKGDRVGLILFGSEPYIQAPLTFDLNTVNQLLTEAQLGMAGKATAIGDATALAVKRLRNRPEESRVLILLTDGANTAGEIPPEKAAELAKTESIKIYTVGIGADEMIQRSFLGNRRVNPSRDLDEKLLTTMAEMTGGQYFRARNAPELELIYEAINRFEPIEQEAKTYRPTQSLFHWPLSMALLIWCGLFISRFVLSRA